MKNIITRKHFSSHSFDYSIPPLLEVQLESYRNFLQANVTSEKRKYQGLQKVFSDIFPISVGNYSLEFESYQLEPSRFTADECIRAGNTYSSSIYVNFSLDIYEGEDDNRKFQEKITDRVYICDMPLMTDRGSFVINGAERVIVSQLHRSPGVSFDEIEDSLGTGSTFKAKLIPEKGSWVEFSLESDDIMYVSVDGRRKIPATILIRLLGFSTNEAIFENFYKSETINISKLELEDINELEHIILRRYSRRKHR